MEETYNIILNKNKSKVSIDKDTLLDLDLYNNEKKLPIESVNTTIDQYKQYINEKDNSNEYRLIYTINTVCSNVLFNKVTEIVLNEGSNECIFYGKNGEKIGPITLYNSYKYENADIKFNREKLIQDTGNSDKEVGCGLTYHCGYDIFNNHILRGKETVVINKLVGKNVNFNTIKDYAREFNGSIIKIEKSNSDNCTDSHLYYNDTIMSFEDSVENNLHEENGWFGFTNKSLPVIKNVYVPGYNVAINKCLNGNKACEFIDMYPDRSLYSFIPKVNSSRKREERNWEYCLTYPYKNYDNNELVSLYDDGKQIANGILSDICDSEGNIVETIDDLLNIIETDEYGECYIRTKFKNNAQSGSLLRLNFVYTKNNKQVVMSDTNSILVKSIGLNGYYNYYYLKINLSDISSIINRIKKDIGDNTNTQIYCYTQRLINGRPCKYYFRQFKRIPNFKGTEVNMEYNLTNEDIEKYCLNDFNTSLNKLGFGLNIYGDRMSQIVVNDSVKLTNLRDNLGRRLSEVYITFIKTNYGNKLWYEDKQYGNSDIEYSHCFSKVTSGIDMPEFGGDYNVHRIHNVDNTKLTYIPNKYKTLEDDITKNGSDTWDENGIFLGDIVELSEDTVVEYVLEDVYHRFNTQQREIIDNEFATISHDELVNDDYDSEFKVVTNTIGNSNCPFNISPEGYYYKPHYGIKIREFSDIVNEGQHTIVKFDNVVKQNNVFNCKTDKNYYFNVGEIIRFYNKTTNELTEGTITYVGGDDYTNISISVNITEDNFINYNIFKVNSEMEFGYYDFNDGSGIYKWRDFESFEYIKSDSELYDSTFTNGAHYHHKNINFFLRRQDPYGIYGLNLQGNDKVDDDIKKFDRFGEYKDVSSSDFFNTIGDIDLC